MRGSSSGRSDSQLDSSSAPVVQRRYSDTTRFASDGPTILLSSQWSAIRCLWEIACTGIHKKNRDCERMNRAWPFRRRRRMFRDLLGKLAGRSACERQELHPCAAFLARSWSRNATSVALFPVPGPARTRACFFALWARIACCSGVGTKLLINQQSSYAAYSSV